MIDEKERRNNMESLLSQVGGTHYKDMEIQPIEYIMKNKLDFPQGSVVKYISRYRSKNKDEDVKKVIHFAILILQLEYGYTDEQIGSLLYGMCKTKPYPMQEEG